MAWLERSMFLWPGLHRLWRRGDWWSLAIAAGFGALFNLALVTTLVWPAWLGEQFSAAIWPLLLLIWGLSYWSVSAEMQKTPTKPASRPVRPSMNQDTLFIQAQREYLNRNWFEAERLVRRRLQLWPRDAEARLLLSSIMRHIGRTELALRELDQLAGYDEGQAWVYEIQRERELIRLIQEHAAAEANESSAARDLPLVSSAENATVSHESHRAA